MAWKERLSDAGYATGWRVVRALPEKAAARAFDRGADFAARRNGGPQQLRRNLARVLGVVPEHVPDELIRLSMRSYARYWREAFRLPSMDLKTITNSPRCPVGGLEHLDAALAKGKGVILALNHSGNWDMAGAWLVEHYGGFTTVAERLKPESLFERFVAYRESLGFEVIPLTGGAQPPFPLLAQRLRENKIICLLSERDLARHGVPVQFFGEQTRFVAGPARLAIETGATLLPVHSWFTEENGVEGWGLAAYPPIDASGGVQAATQALADVFANNIFDHAQDWHMLQPLWIADLSERRQAMLSGESP